MHPFGASSFVVGPNNSTVLHAAAGAYNKIRTPAESAQIFSYLLKKFPYEEHLESQEVTSGFTPLMIAVLSNDKEAVRALLKAGASLDTPSQSGYPLRDAKLISAVALATGHFRGPETTYEDTKYAETWREMTKIIFAASEQPIIKPKERPAISPRGTPSCRIETFLRLVQAAKLMPLKEMPGEEVLELEAEGIPDPDILAQLVSTRDENITAGL